MKNQTIGIIIGVIVVLILIYLYLKRISAVNRQIDTSSNNGTSNTNTYNSNTSTNTSTGTGIGTGTGTGTPILPSNQITLTKSTPVYYLQLPTQPNYPYTPSSNTVSNVTLPQGKTLTISKTWNFGGGQVFYETTEKVLYVTNPSSHGLGDYYLVKKSDI